MRKALFINGSPRKNGNTAQLLKSTYGAQEPTFSYYFTTAFTSVTIFL